MFKGALRQEKMQLTKLFQPPGSPEGASGVKDLETAAEPTGGVGGGLYRLHLHGRARRRGNAGITKGWGFFPQPVNTVLDLGQFQNKLPHYIFLECSIVFKAFS